MHVNMKIGKTDKKTNPESSNVFIRYETFELIIYKFLTFIIQPPIPPEGGQKP